MLNKTSQSKYHTAVNIGKFDNLMSYSLGELKGKIFLKEEIDASAVEISFQLLPPQTALPFFHSHKQNEEIYVFLKGEGQFQVDDEVFGVKEGSIVRIAPSASRSINNSSDTAMIYIVIQAKENSLQQYTMDDGIIEETEPKWK